MDDAKRPHHPEQEGDGPVVAGPEARARSRDELPTDGKPAPEQQPAGDGESVLVAGTEAHQHEHANAPRHPEKRRKDAALDDALDDSFPSSDPVQLTDPSKSVVNEET